MRAVGAIAATGFANLRCKLANYVNLYGEDKIAKGLWPLDAATQEPVNFMLCDYVNLQ